MGSYKSCSDCKNLLSAGGHCYYYGYLTDYSGTLRNYYLGDDDAEDCPHFEGKYSSGGGGCFLTSAVVKHMGKADDCDELTTLRAFRDNYMKSFDEGRKLVEEYYEIAPQIVSAIDSSDNKDRYYEDIYSTVQTCVSLIKGGKNEDTMGLYRGMVNKYKALLA